MATLGAHQYHTSGSSAMTPGTGVSRLSMMQARLREQLMLDKESRLLQMAAKHEEEQEGTIKRVTKSSASSSTLSSSLSSLSSFNASMGGGQGRVRKLFQERRSNGYGNSPVGRDKSYPLDPVRSNVGGGGGSGGRPPVKPVKGLVRNRGVSVDRGKASYDPEAMRRSRSHAAFQNSINNNSYNNNEQRSPARGLRPPQGRTLQHHKSTSSLLDANQNYNGRGSSSSSGVYSRGASREPSPAPSPSPSSLNRFGFRGPPSRGPSPAPSPGRVSPPRASAPLSQHRPSNVSSRPSQPPSQPPRQRPVPPPRQRPTQPPRQAPPRRKSPPRRQSPPVDEDEYDSAYVSPRPSNNYKSKPSPEGPSITKVKTAVRTPQPPARPTPPPKPKATAPAPRPSKPVPGLDSCKICGRNFAPDRIEKHETICAKSQAKQKKRKVFDPVKMRTKGTEAEKFVAKGKHLAKKPQPKKKDWKKQHEEFIAAIRAAKSGKEAPPVDNSDYIECPHCFRKFSEQVADRHIPKCANISSNKTPAQRNRR